MIQWFFKRRYNFWDAFILIIVNLALSNREYMDAAIIMVVGIILSVLGEIWTDQPNV